MSIWMFIAIYLSIGIFLNHLFRNDERFHSLGRYLTVLLTGPVILIAAFVLILAAKKARK